jgi:hypothetical protein
MRGVPGFQAEASLGRSSGCYRATAGLRPPGAGSSMRVSPTALGLGLGRDLFEIKCCQFVQGRGLVCTKRHQEPGEDCTCVHTRFGPLITCSPRVFTTS